MNKIEEDEAIRLFRAIAFRLYRAPQHQWSYWYDLADKLRTLAPQGSLWDYGQTDIRKHQLKNSAA